LHVFINETKVGLNKSYKTTIFRHNPKNMLFKGTGFGEVSKAVVRLVGIVEKDVISINQC
jgi:hypothetical protein